MIDLNNPYTLNILLMGTLILITILVLYIIVLRRKNKELVMVCSTDLQLHRVLRITDDLLGKLSNSELEAFVTSPDFEIYKDALKPVILGHKHLPEPAKIEPKPAINEAKKDPPKEIPIAPIVITPVSKPAQKKPMSKPTTKKKK